jgi:hypothetical protein
MFGPLNDAMLVPGIQDWFYRHSIAGQGSNPGLPKASIFLIPWDIVSK